MNQLQQSVAADAEYRNLPTVLLYARDSEALTQNCANFLLAPFNCNKDPTVVVRRIYRHWVVLR